MLDFLFFVFYLGMQSVFILPDVWGKARDIKSTAVTVCKLLFFGRFFANKFIPSLSGNAV